MDDYEGTYTDNDYYSEVDNIVRLNKRPAVFRPVVSDDDKRLNKVMREENKKERDLQLRDARRRKFARMN